MRFTIATYNIHKGFTQLNRRMVIHELRDRLVGLDPDILFLQEVAGDNARHAARHLDWPVKPQHEFIAGSVWQEIAYGKNAVYRHGHHGNAVLSRFPIVTHENQDISAHPFESRGLLHCEIRLAGERAALHCINVHLGLFERGRQWQLRALCERIAATVPRDAPLVIAGDFNDWRARAHAVLQRCAGLKEVFTHAHGRAARTFPARFPVLRLDRIYVRNAAAHRPVVLPPRPWTHLSDHAPLLAELTL